MLHSGSSRFRWILVCLALTCPATLPAENPGAGSEPGFTFNPPPCQGNVFNDVNCSGLFDAWIEQFARDGITGGCGGGNYCPNNSVTRGQMAVFFEKSMRGSATWPPNTVLVHAVLKEDGSVNEVASGQALLDAVAAIPTNAPHAPDPGHMWLIKVGAGTFDLGDERLVLPNYVVLEGSGGGGVGSSPPTIIAATGSTSFDGTIVAAPSVSEIHDLAVRSTGGTRAIAISNDGGSLLLDRVTALGSTGNSSYGVYALGGEVRISESTLAASGNGVNSAMGLYAENTAVTVERSLARPAGATNSNGAYGLYLVGGSLEMADSRIESNVSADTPIYGIRLSGGASASVRRTEIRVSCNGTGFAYGLYPQAPDLFQVLSSRVEASGTGCEANALRAFDASVSVTDSFLQGTGTASAAAIKAMSASAGRGVGIVRSSLISNDLVIDNGANYNTRIRGSELFGGIVNTGALACVASYTLLGELGSTCL